MCSSDLNAQALDESKNNYIMSIVYVSDRFGISFADVTTGDYFVTEVDSSRKLMDELYKFTPREVICNEALLMSGVELDDLKDIDIITFDIIILQAYIYYAQRNDNSNSKGLKAIYKKYCADVIKRHGLPATLSEYIKVSRDYL